MLAAKRIADYSKHLEKTFGAPDEMTDEQTVWHNVDGSQAYCL